MQQLRVRANNKGNALIALVVVAMVVAVGAAVVLFAFTTELPDVNEPVSETGDTSIGYFDVAAVLELNFKGTCTIHTVAGDSLFGFGFFKTGEDEEVAEGCELSVFTGTRPAVTVEEHRSSPAAPASFVDVDLGTILVSRACTVEVTMQATGPGLSVAAPPKQTSPAESVAAGQSRTFRYGHTYAFAEDAYGLDFEVWVSGCYNYKERTPIDHVIKNFLFDGVND
jgi:hypothetical protein